jgi:hypothetical protein
MRFRGEENKREDSRSIRHAANDIWGVSGVQINLLLPGLLEARNLVGQEYEEDFNQRNRHFR